MGCSLAFVGATAFGQERVSGSVRAGMEYDDNALRTEAVEPVPDFLARYFTALTMQYPAAAPRSSFVFDLAHGGKFFMAEPDADTLLTQVYVGYQQRLGQPIGIYAQLDIKDRTERISRRDYNRGGGGAGLDVFLGDFSLRTGVAARYFAFKPSPDASSSNVESSSRVRWDFLPSAYAALSYTYARRAFSTTRFLLRDGLVEEDPNVERSDTFHVVSASVGWRGPVVLEAAYAYSVNDSNSYGQNLGRHSADLTGTAALPWQLFLSAHLELQRTTYEDPVLIDADFLVDEDNRNSLVGSVARALGDSWEVEVRYSLYLQEFGVGSDYSRQTVMLAAGYLF
ncbi:MAG: hypothetical protein R3E66_07660 [bacterium]